MERAEVNVNGLWIVDWIKDAYLVWTWRRTTLTRACNHGEWRAALSPGWSSCATRRKSVKRMIVCLYIMLYFDWGFHSYRIHELGELWEVIPPARMNHLDWTAAAEGNRSGEGEESVNLRLAWLVRWILQNWVRAFTLFFLSAYPTSMESCLVSLKLGYADGYAALPMPLFFHSYTQLFAPFSLRWLRTIFNHLIKFFSIQFNSIQKNTFMLRTLRGKNKIK